MCARKKKHFTCPEEAVHEETQDTARPVNLRETLNVPDFKDNTLINPEHWMIFKQNTKDKIWKIKSTKFLLIWIIILKSIYIYIFFLWSTIQVNFFLYKPLKSQSIRTVLKWKRTFIIKSFYSLLHIIQLPTLPLAIFLCEVL